MTRSLLIAAFAFSLFALAPSAFAVAVPNGQYCNSNAGCQSGYCSLDHTFFTFLNQCATPPANTGTRTIGGCTSGSCTFAGDCNSGQVCTGATDIKCSGTCVASSATCTDEPRTPIPCANYAGSFGIPAGYTQGNASWTQNSCTQAVTYKGGCSAPTNGGTQPSGGGGINPTQPSGGGGVTNVTLINPLKSGATVQSFLNSILDFVITIGAIIVMLMLVYVGFLFVTAQGNDTKLTTAKQALLWTIIGALILLGAKAIALGLQATVTALSAGQ